MKTPKIPDPKKAPLSNMAAMLNTASTPTAGIYRPISPMALGLNATRPGRRSLIGG